MARETRFLGIETSCDETAAAVFTDDGRVLSSVVHSQHSVHARFGGVVPELAARAHLSRMIPVIDEALKSAGVR
ncbi:MAG: tRNA (adenosine(37)-N6)-threonylcarbamoyltransferase complex transferase subunit TsaD, partial [Planctomycetota bacterium]